MQEAVLASGERLSQAEYGSDLAVELFASLGIPYIALNPGSSYRGLHDSFVNFKTPGVPEMVTCCHEEIAVAVAHGYARVTGKPLLVGLHDVVGLQHAAMAIYNAWCDRVPVICIGGTGPVAADRRRPHIDWVHTANVQGNLVRDFTKMDDQPASLGAIPESILRAYRSTMTEPSGPVYLCFDVDLQEQAVSDPIRLPDVKRFAPPAPIAPDPESLRQLAEMLAAARYPVLLAEAVGRHREALPALKELAELLQAPVVSTGRFNLASDHPLNVSASRQQVLAEADLILGLDVFDFSGALGPGTNPERPESQYVRPDCKLATIALWELLQRSWASDYEFLAPTDLSILADTRIALPLLTALVRQALERDASSRGRIEDRSRAIEALQARAAERAEAAAKRRWDSRPIVMDRVLSELHSVVAELGVPWSFVNGGGRTGGWEITEPDHSVGGGRGAGLGQAAGTAVGASLAYKGTDRLCISVIGDGNLLYTPSALWTAANQRLPLVTIVNNNRSYGNDEGHQDYIARTRGRPYDETGTGIYIEDPATDFTHLAKSFDIEGFGPVDDPDKLGPVLRDAVGMAVREQRPVLIDVRTAKGLGRRG